jgi:leader peptidase (prepilin peptidase)/N-methyltransferase
MLILASLYLLTVVIDLDTQLIPHEITVTQFVTAWAFFFLARPDTISPSWQSSLYCMLGVAALFGLMCWLGWMGDADIWLVAGFGVLFGWPLLPVAVMLGFILGGIIAVPILIRLKARGQYEPGKHALAFGPYLAISAYLCLFFGRDLISWYLGLFGLKVLQNWHVVSAHPPQL